jgi:hypothetical protein
MIRGGGKKKIMASKESLAMIKLPESHIYIMVNYGTDDSSQFYCGYTVTSDTNF